MEDIKKKLLEVIKHLRYAAKQASAEGKVQLGILAVKEDGTGRILARIDAAYEFIEDIAKLIDAPAQTEEDEMEAKAVEFLHKMGLKG